jgi:putative heme-binding domain-containing protein
MVTDGTVELPARRQAIAALARQRSSGLREVLVKLVGDRDLGVSSIDALVMVGGDAEAQHVLSSYPNLHTAAKEAALRFAASRRDSAELLLEKISDNSIPRQDIQATTLRQLQILGDKAWNERITQLFPQTKKLNEDKRQRMVALHEKLQKLADLPANPSAGRTIFDNSCSKCHRLFGSGSQIGPELTGSQRSNLNYLIENLVDPSAQLADTYRTSVLRLEDGRVLMGVILQRNEKVVSLQTVEDKLSIPTEEIEEMEQTNNSLMPEGLLDSLSDQQLRDLFAYLQSTQQVAPMPQ